jgi:hypothetical protein
MAGTNLIVCRQRLISDLQAMVGPSGALGPDVVVDYSYVAKHHESTAEYICGGNSEGAVSASAMQGGGRLKREESPDWPLAIVVTRKGEETTEDADVRAVAIGAVIENHLARYPRLEANAAAITGLLKATITAWSLNSWPTDDAVHAQLTYTIQFDSYLT